MPVAGLGGGFGAGIGVADSAAGIRGAAAPRVGLSFPPAGNAGNALGNIRGAGVGTGAANFQPPHGMPPPPMAMNQLMPPMAGMNPRINSAGRLPAGMGARMFPGLTNPSCDRLANDATSSVHGMP